MPTVAARIVTKRKLFLRVLDSNVCEEWSIEVPSLLDESRGRLRRAATATDPAVTLGFTRTENTLSLSEACGSVGKRDLCLPCETQSGSISAFARLDECETNAVDAAALSGCTDGVSSQWRDNLRATMSGELGVTLMSQLAKTKRVSLRDATCKDYFVRIAGKRVLLDDEAWEYPTEIKALDNGTLSIGEVAETNPRFRPRTETIAMGCCGGGEVYRVLSHSTTRANLMRVGRDGFGPVGGAVELHFRACDKKP